MLTNMLTYELPENIMYMTDQRKNRMRYVLPASSRWPPVFDSRGDTRESPFLMAL